MEGFGIITSKLKEMYQMITLGGDAELELVDSLNLFTEGIVFSVKASQKVLEEHFEFVQWREDFVILGSHLRPA